MKRLIDAGLEQLASMLFRMGELAQKTVSVAIFNYIEDTHAPDEVKNLSDTLSSMAEPIEDTVFEIMARFQPVASDLRILKSYMKICYDFERFGRYAFDVSQIYEKLGGMKERSFKRIIKGMSEETLKMVSTSIQSLKSYDVKLAKTLSEMEKKVDNLYSRYLNRLIKTNVAKGSVISSLLVVRYLERIADHAAYIGESIVYLATGEKMKLR
jgi:phosphate transport system protein